MQRILKYELKPKSNNFNFSVGSRILSVGVDGLYGRLSMWVAVNTDEDAVCTRRSIYLYSTGEDTGEDTLKTFLGTIIDNTQENTKIWHAYLMTES